ncbi:MAG TPA: M48 family metallopeptidase [Saprospiraceae bacterium]|nr:M48 family metallopeptidase [Saprospiraceae bacterium]
MLKRSLILLLFLPLFVACSKNIFTGRKSLNLIPVSTLNQMSFTEYRSFLSQNKPMTSGSSEVDMVRRVGNDLKLATESYYRSKGKAAELKDFAWEFNVVDDPTVNAFCMPGGKVVVYTGILKVTQNEDALAVVMGHEIAHALAHHGNERMSQGLVTQLGLTTLDLGLALSQKPAATRQLLMQAAGAGAALGVILPFSRKHESEADEIGLYLMAMAGYNPSEAAPFWERMNKSGGARPPEFLSTHPDPAKRSQKLKELVPKARAYAQKYPVAGTSRRK